MAIAFVNAAQGGQYNNSAGTVSTAAQNVTTGNAMVVFCTQQTATDHTTGTVTDTAGNTYTRVAAATVKNATNGHEITAFYSLNVIGNASNVTTCNFTGAGATGYVSVHALQFSGVATASALDAATATSFNTGAAATSITSGTFSTVQADEVSVSCSRVFVGTAAQTFTFGSEDGNYTIPTNGKDTEGVSAAQYNVFTATKTNTTASMSSVTSLARAISVMTFKGAAAAGGNPWHAYAQQ